MVLSVIDSGEVIQRKHTFAEGKRTYGSRWWFLTNERDADPVELRPLVQAAVPSYWASDTTALLGGIDLIQEAGKPALWWADLTYDINAANDEDPLSKRRELSFTWSQYQRLAYLDIYGEPILNTMGDITPTEVDDARAEIRLVWNASSFSPAIADQYRNAVNLDTWFGLDPYCAKVAGLTATEKLTSSGVVYFTIEATIQANGDTWKRKIPNRGFYTWSGLINATTKARLKQRILDKDGQPTEEPDFISEDGYTVLPQGTPPVVLEKEIYPALSFSGFFPTS